MNKNIKLLYCILGSIILSLAGTSIPYNALRFLPVIGALLADIAYIISGIGVLLTIVFSIILIAENLKYKSK
jgi:hypothetical protein